MDVQEMLKEARKIFEKLDEDNAKSGRVACSDLSTELSKRDRELRPKGVGFFRWQAHCSRLDEITLEMFLSYLASVRLIDMWHVSNVASDQGRPDWTEINTTIANDELFDGPLLGLSVACFTTTANIVNNVSTALPTSPYPRNADPDIKHWRVKLSFDPAEHNIYLMHTPQLPDRSNGTKRPEQHHLLCIPKHSPTEHEQEVERCLRGVKPKLSGGDLKTYFPNGGGNHSNGRMYVNVHFCKPVPISASSFWDTVPKKANGGNKAHGHNLLDTKPGATDEQKKYYFKLWQQNMDDLRVAAPLKVATLLEEVAELIKPMAKLPEEMAALKNQISELNAQVTAMLKAAKTQSAN